MIFFRFCDYISQNIIEFLLHIFGVKAKFIEFMLDFTKGKTMIKSRLWIDKDGKNFLGHGKVELLEKIKEHGSINAAAKSMKMSYKAAWDTIDSINNLANSPIVVKIGNGSKISEEGERLIRKFREIEAKQDEFLSQFDDDLSQNKINLFALSAKNQFNCIVRGIRSDDVSVDLELCINKNITIFSNITKDSFDRLKISVGSAVIAVIKANLIKLSKQKPKSKNIIKCEISQIKKGENSVQISLNSSELNLTATTKDFSDFEIGQKIYAYFKAESVIIGK